MSTARPAGSIGHELSNFGIGILVGAAVPAALLRGAGSVVSWINGVDQLSGGIDAGLGVLLHDYHRHAQIPEHIVTALRHILIRQFDALRAASKAERHTLAQERDKLRDERRSLIHAHHA